MGTAAFHAGGAGEPMVLLHGFMGDWRVWAPVLPELESRYEAFAPNLPGHWGGEAMGAGPVTIPAMVDLLERQLDEHGVGRAHLVGNSLGGWLALELAIRGRALSVVALCPGGAWERGSAEERGIYRYFWRTRRTVSLLQPWFRTIASRPRLRSLAFRDMVRHPSRLSASVALGALEAAAGCTIVDDLLALSKREAVFGELGTIDCPLTFAAATHDRLFSRPGHYVKLRRLLPDASWISLENMGHIPMSDDPAAVAAAIIAGAHAG